MDLPWIFFLYQIHTIIWKESGDSTVKEKISFFGNTRKMMMMIVLDFLKNIDSRKINELSIFVFTTNIKLLFHYLFPSPISLIFL